jgi:hypothetical protein
VALRMIRSSAVMGYVHSWSSSTITLISRNPGAGPGPRRAWRSKVRQRASRRAGQGAGDEVEAEARAQRVAATLMDWYHDHVGPWLLA